MELPSKLLEQISFNTRPKINEHVLIVMDESTHEEHLEQPLQTNNKDFKIAVTLTGYNGIFNVKNRKNRFYFEKTITDEDGFIKRTIAPGAYELESLNKEIKRIIINQGHYNQKEYPFTIKPNFPTLGSIIEIKPQVMTISFMFDDSLRDLLGFHAITLYEEYNLSPNRVDILSFDNIFIHTNLSQGMNFKSKRSGVFPQFYKGCQSGIQIY